MALLRPYVIPGASRIKIAASMLGITARLTRTLDHKGLYRLAQWLTPVFRHTDTFEVQLAPDLTVTFPTNAYWLRMLAADYEYEGELGRLFSALRPLPYLFFDCGANIGYWSTLVGHEVYGDKQGAAIEAGSQAFRILEKNLKRNGIPITPYHFALSDFDGETATLNFAEGSLCDAGATIVNDDDHPKARSEHELVKTMTLDTLIRRTSEDDKLPLVIKLDIEGMEGRVLGGSEELSARDCLIVAEDHGNDPQCNVTKCLIDLGYKSAYLHEVSGGFWIENIHQLQHVKTNANKGYNVFAAREGSCFNLYLHQLIAH